MELLKNSNKTKNKSLFFYALIVITLIYIFSYSSIAIGWYNPLTTLYSGYPFSSYGYLGNTFSGFYPGGLYGYTGNTFLGFYPTGFYGYPGYGICPTCSSGYPGSMLFGGNFVFPFEYPTIQDYQYILSLIYSICPGSPPGTCIQRPALLFHSPTIPPFPLTAIAQQTVSTYEPVECYWVDETIVCFWQ